MQKCVCRKMGLPEKWSSELKAAPTAPELTMDDLLPYIKHPLSDAAICLKCKPDTLRNIAR